MDSGVGLQTERFCFNLFCVQQITLATNKINIIVIIFTAIAYVSFLFFLVSQDNCGDLNKFNLFAYTNLFPFKINSLWYKCFVALFCAMFSLFPGGKQVLLVPHLDNQLIKTTKALTRKYGLSAIQIPLYANNPQAN